MPGWTIPGQLKRTIFLPGRTLPFRNARPLCSVNGQPQMEDSEWTFRAIPSRECRGLNGSSLWQPEDFRLNNNNNNNRRSWWKEEQDAPSCVVDEKGFCVIIMVFLSFAWNNGLCAKFYNSSSSAQGRRTIKQYSSTLVCWLAIHKKGGNTKSL